MSQINKFGIKDAANLTIKYRSGTKAGKVFLYSDYANVVTNEWSADTVYAKAKGVNAIGWDGNKNSTLKATFEVMDKKLFALTLGADIEDVELAKIFAHERGLAVSATKVTLEATPVADSISVFAANEDGSDGEEVTFTVSEKVLTLSGESLPTVVNVYFQKEISKAKRITINANKFAENFEIVGDTTVKATDGSLSYVQMDWLNCKVQANASLGFDAENPASLELTFDILPYGTKQDMATYTFYEE